jgi:hypothetical protein
MKYRLLGNSGLRVSEAALGAMTFGEEWVGVPQRTKREGCTTPSAKPEAISLIQQTSTPTGRANHAQVETLDEASWIELGFPYDLYRKELPRTFMYGGMGDQILV